MREYLKDPIMSFLKSNDVIDLYINGKLTPTVDMAQYLGSRNYFCPPKFSEEIDVIKLLGEGAFGKTMLIKFKNDPSQTEYAVKIINIPKPLVAKLATNLDDYIQNNKIIDPILAKILHLGVHEKYMLDTPLMYKCKLEIPYPYLSNLDYKTILTLPPGTEMCQMDSKYVPASEYGEFVISKLVANLKTINNCINFTESFEFGMCVEPPTKTSSGMQTHINIYNFMEVIKGKDMYNSEDDGLLNIKDSDVMTPIIIQVMFAIEAYQRLGISHNDLHGGNVMLENINSFQGGVGEKVWLGQNITKAKYLSYKIDGVQLYFPKGSWIAKIIDWGFACKFPNVAEGVAIMRKDIVKSASGQGRPDMPNEFVSMYDLLFFLYNHHTQYFAQSIIYEVLNLGPPPYDSFKIRRFYEPSGRPLFKNYFKKESKLIITTDNNFNSKEYKFEIKDGQSIIISNKPESQIVKNIHDLKIKEAQCKILFINDKILFEQFGTIENSDIFDSNGNMTVAKINDTVEISEDSTINMGDSTLRFNVTITSNIQNTRNVCGNLMKNSPIFKKYRRIPLGSKPEDIILIGEI